jgi:hypothetical protein
MVRRGSHLGAMVMNKESSFIGSVPELYERYLVPMHFETHTRTFQLAVSGRTAGD